MIHSFTREFTLNSLSVMQIYYEFVYFLANLLWVHYQLRKITMNWLSLSWTHYGSIIVFSSIIVSVWIRFLFHDLNINSLWVTRIHYGFVIFFADSQWIHYQILESFLSSLSFSRNPYKLTILFNICFAESKWIHYQIFDFTLDSLPFSRSPYNFTSFFIKSVWFHYWTREFTIN